MTLTPLLPLMYEPLVRTALLEDLGRAGDITADAIVLEPTELRERLYATAKAIVNTYGASVYQA